MAEQQPDLPDPQTPSRSELETEKDTSTSGDERDGDARSHPLNSRKRKSILQPTGSKYSKKAAGRRRSIPLIDQAPAEKEDGLDGADDVSVFQENSPLLPAKHQDAVRLSSHTRANQPLSTSRPAAYHTYYPGKYHAIKVIKYDIPSNRPQGPGDLWTCTFKGCGHRVHEGSTANGIERIKAHFENHTHQAQEKIDLAYKESRPYLPVEYVWSFSRLCCCANNFKKPCSSHSSSSS